MADSLLNRVLQPLVTATIGKTTYADMRRMEDLVHGSELEWTIMRPSGLFDAPGERTSGSSSACPDTLTWWQAASRSSSVFASNCSMSMAPVNRAAHCRATELAGRLPEPRGRRTARVGADVWAVGSQRVARRVPRKAVGYVGARDNSMPGGLGCAARGVNEVEHVPTGLSRRTATVAG
jgi:hypothetical protein